MSKHTRGWLFAVVAALGLSACGGGSLSGDGDGDPDAQVPTQLALLASSLQLPSNADSPTNGVILTAVVKDADNVVVPGVAVSFSTADSAELTVASAAQTDASGRVQATLSTGGDPENRSITVRARVSTGTGSTLTRSLVINVVGTRLTISGPTATQINTPTDYTAVLLDAADVGIPGVTVNVDTQTGNTITPGAGGFVTNAAGIVSFTLSATRANTSLNASALGLTTSQNVAVSTDDFSFTAPNDGQEVNIGTVRTITTRWFRGNAPVPNGTVVNFTVTRGTLSAASATTTNGLASVTITSTESGPSLISASGTLAGTPVVTGRSIEFVAVTPDKLDLQASPANIGVSQSSELTAVVRDPTNNLVKNTTVDFSLSDLSAGSLSASSAVTNGQGVAKVTYTASSQASATRGVTVTARVRSNSAISNTARITVGARAVDITIGTGSEILSLNEATYQLPFTVIVADSSGNPVSDASFTLSYEPTRFFKGSIDPETGEITYAASCNNEDVNRNDILDVSEDLDADGELEPGRVATVPTTVDLDPDSGSGRFLLTYPKDRGLWVEVRIIGTATVAGSSATETRTLILPIADGDEDNLPAESPYGVSADCADPE